MKAKAVTEAEMAPLRVSSLPTRPTAPAAFGGKGYTAKEMKEAFDRLPELAIERINDLIDDVGSGELAKSLATGITAAPTLAKLLSDLESGSLASYMGVFGTTLAAYLSKLREDVDEIKEALNI